MFPLKDTIPSYRTPWVNYFLIGINTVVFLYEISLPSYKLQELFYLYGLVPAFLEDRIYTLFTNMFLHGGWGHFIMNMWMLYLFGDNVEDLLGHFRYLIFYLLCGVFASLMHFIIHMDSTIPAIGASGAISGVMGAYMIFFPHSRIITLVPLFFWPFLVEIHAFFYLLFWFIGQLFSGALLLILPEGSSSIAFWAHIGGFVAGIFLGKLFLRPRKSYEVPYLWWEE